MPTHHLSPSGIAPFTNLVHTDLRSSTRCGGPQQAWSRLRNNRRSGQLGGQEPLADLACGGCPYNRPLKARVVFICFPSREP